MIHRAQKGGGIYRRVRRLLFIAGAFCCLLAILTFFAMNRLDLGSSDERRMRVDFNTLVKQAENGTLTQSEKAHYALFGTDGKVLDSTLVMYRKGMRVDLHTFSGINGTKNDGEKIIFISPVVRHHMLSGMLLVSANKADYRTPNQMLLILTAVFLLFDAGILLLLFLTLRLVKNDFFKPLALLHDTTRHMLQGDLETRLLYDDDGEIGSLCHDFEAMRDELSAAFRRESDLLKGESVLFASVSHDLKTPLAAISGYAEEIYDGIASTPAQIHQFTGQMLKKVRLLTKLIDDILEETQVQIGELTFVFEEVYAKPFFEDVCEELSLDTARFNIAFSADEIPDVLITIDRKRITQVMQNLISNSIKYKKRNGLISIHFNVEGSNLIICVKDNGRGIAASDLPFIFNRFYRGDAARTQDIPGSGLGLCIVKNIVERHGGHIECDSVLGNGTAMCFSLPL